jgi:AcrR family transcriptional regulator
VAWDSQETRRRLLEAAISEFSARGIAGARVDRIASAAKANKQAIYAYFGSKDALFAAAFEDRIRDFHASVVFYEYDLAEYGGRMFDKFEDAPETLRLVLWYQLEHVAGPPLEVILDSNEEKVGRIAAAQQAGKVTGAYPAVALLGLARSTAMVWHTQIPELAPMFPSDRRDRREMVVRAIGQILDQ